MEVVQLKYMISRSSEANPPHSVVIHEKLTSRGLVAHVPEMVDEVQLAVQEHLSSADTGRPASAKVKTCPPGVQMLPPPRISARAREAARLGRWGRTHAQSPQSRATFGRDRVPMLTFMVVT